MVVFHEEEVALEHLYFGALSRPWRFVGVAPTSCEVFTPIDDLGAREVFLEEVVSLMILDLCAS